jgi:ribosomal protein S18 acetylase RimI-like enzyme
MSRSLPPRPTLEHLKKEAKAILRAHQMRDAAVVPTLRRLHRFAKAGDAEIFAADVALHDAQCVLAMDYGFESWDKLKRRVEASAPPLRQAPSDRWFHGSTRAISELSAGSTVTPVVELARAFAHGPRNVSMQIHENDEQNLRRITISHDGSQDGYLYEVAITDAAVDLRPHPTSTMAPGDEMVTTRELPVRLLELASLETGREQNYEEPLRNEVIADTPRFEIITYGPEDVMPQEVEAMLGDTLADTREMRQQPNGTAWALVCVCAVTADKHVLGGAHFDMGPINGGPLADERVAVIEGVFVRPEHRRRGIGTALMERAVEIARQGGCTHMRCNSRWDNPAEIALFKRTGFALTDINDVDESGWYFTVRPL